jgi:hypothetical protein
LLLSCAGSANSGGGGSSGPIPLAQLPSTFGTELCGSLSTCCRSNNFPYDPATCQQNLTAFFEGRVTGLNIPTVKYDPVAAGQCLSAYEQVFNACNISLTNTSTLTALDTACNLVFTGTLAVGAACSKDEECIDYASGNGYCNITTVDGTGVCAQDAIPTAGTRGKAGDACISTCPGVNSTCATTIGTNPGSNTFCYTADGLACSAGVCAPLASLGQPCVTYGCVAGTYCDSATSVCIPQTPNGNECLDDFSCQSGKCNYPDTGGVATPPAAGTGGATGSPGGGVAGAAGGPTIPMGVCGPDTVASAAVCSGNLDN